MYPNGIENPFSQYQMLFPDNRIESSHCREVSLPVSVYEPANPFYCIFETLQEPIYRIAVYGSDGRITSTRFHTRLQYGDLVGLFGLAEEINDYYNSRYYYWKSQGIIAYSRAIGRQAAMRSPILYVYQIGGE